MANDKKFGDDEPEADDPERDESEGKKDHNEEDGLNSLYRDVIFEHYRRPHNKRAIDGAQIVTKGNNPVCGDRVTVYAKVGADGKIHDVGFDGKGCAICIASSSLMTEAVKGKSLEEAGKISDHFKAMMRNEAPFEVPSDLPDMEALEGVRKFSVRVKCATLSWTTLKNGIVEYQAGKHGGEHEERCDIA
ncbi:MAG TPA: SUF system NifU family Fe-S cluster assembly protein [Planctomycetota bacterium]|nr:SUF system NifU family Fe-S cluster assembly protein [Planctomycetota bacterium]